MLQWVPSACCTSMRTSTIQTTLGKAMCAHACKTRLGRRMETGWWPAGACRLPAELQIQWAIPSQEGAKEYKSMMPDNHLWPLQVCRPTHTYAPIPHTLYIPTKKNRLRNNKILSYVKEYIFLSIIIIH